jgi:hypothetical protein
MWKASAAAALFVGTLSFGSSAAPDAAKKVIDEASKATGILGLNSISYAGAAAIGNFGQSRTISFGLASTSIKNYLRTIDFAAPASRASGDAQPPALARGGPLPAMTTYSQVINAQTPAWAQQMEIWVTPWGFLKGAAANDATLKTQKIDGVVYNVLTWSPPQKAPSGLPYKISGYIAADNMVEHTETWIDHPIIGDLHQEFFYKNYQSFGGVMVPGRISQKQIGMETFVASINAVLGNPPDLERRMEGPPPRRRSWPTAYIASPAATCRSPLSSRTTSSCSKADRAKRAASPSSLRRRNSFRRSGSSTSS